MNRTETNILDGLARARAERVRHITAKDVAARAGYSPATARRVLDRLAERGLVRRLDVGSGARRIYLPKQPSP